MYPWSKFIVVFGMVVFVSIAKPGTFIGGRLMDERLLCVYKDWTRYYGKGERSGEDVGG